MNYEILKPIEQSVYNGRLLSTFDDNLSLPRHRWYEFKEGFSRNLVLEAIKDAETKVKKLNILDPFSGCGTTLVTAGQHKQNGVGIEINPFLEFASRAKCSSSIWNEKLFNSVVSHILNQGQYEVASPIEGLSTFSEKPGLDKWLFNLSVLRGFEALKLASYTINDYKQEILLALFASLMDCCNARRDGKCLRYRRDWQSLGFNSKSLRDSFKQHLAEIRFDLANFTFDATALTIIRGDAREVLDDLDQRRFDLLVTSPPYLNSFDYSDVYRPELFAGGFVKNNAELRKIRLKTIRSHVQATWEPSHTIESQMIYPLLKELEERQLWNRHLPDMIVSYFVDMALILRKASRLMRRGGSAWIVVGTSAYAGVEIPVDLILADIASRNGWNLQGVYVIRQLRSAGQQWQRLGIPKRKPLRESLIILRTS